MMPIHGERNKKSGIAKNDKNNGTKKPATQPSYNHTANERLFNRNYTTANNTTCVSCLGIHCPC